MKDYCCGQVAHACCGGLPLFAGFSFQNLPPQADGKEANLGQEAFQKNRETLFFPLGFHPIHSNNREQFSACFPPTQQYIDGVEEKWLSAAVQVKESPTIRSKSTTKVKTSTAVSN